MTTTTQGTTANSSAGPVATNLLATIVTRTLAVFPDLTRLLLFGSRARGTMTVDSDYDLLVVVPNLPPGAGRSVPLRLALRGLGAAFDIVVLTPVEFVELQHSNAQLAQTLTREAVVLYEAA